MNTIMHALKLISVIKDYLTSMVYSHTVLDYIFIAKTSACEYILMQLPRFYVTD